MRNITMTALALTAVGLLLGSAAYAAPGGASEEDAAMLAKAKIPMSQAISAAEQYANGTAVLAELENENGTPVYGVEVVSGSKTTDVKVDSSTGKVLRAEKDQRDSDRRAVADESEGEQHGDTHAED